MVILAGAIVLTLNNSGIINKASEAVDITDMKQVEELAQLGWAQAYIDAEDKTDVNVLRAGVVSALEKTK